jgi:hypothetical protein
MPLSNRAEELRQEQALLVKAELDIEQGWGRLRNQQDLVDQLQGAGRDTAQAERLVALMKQTLVEWERHRRLIEQRVAHLQNEVSGL